MPSPIHYTHSSLREKIIEHLFVGEILREAWRRRRTDIEVLQPEVDRGGYDVVFDSDGGTRHVQLKASYSEAKTAFQNIHTSLSAKPSACVVWVRFDEDTLDLGPFHWFGASLGNPLPDVSRFTVAKHTKGNAQGVKAERPALRRVPKGQFELLPTIEAVFDALFDSSSGRVP